MSCDIMAVKRRLTAVYPFFGSMAAGAGYIETEGTGKVSNDGMNILYDPEYMAGLSDGQQMSVLAHELCHIAFRHASRGAGKDPAIWDDATAAVINQMLKRDGLELIPSWIDYPEAIGYDAEQYYEILLSGKPAVKIPQAETVKKERDPIREMMTTKLRKILMMRLRRMIRNSCRKKLRVKAPRTMKKLWWKAKSRIPGMQSDRMKELWRNRNRLHL